MSDFAIDVRDWNSGVRSASPPDEIADNALSLAFNTAFRSIGTDKVVIGQRPGMTAVNTTVHSHTSGITTTASEFRWMKKYTYLTKAQDADPAESIACVHQSGGVFLKNADDTLSAELTSPIDTNYPFESSYRVDGAVFGSRLFIINDAGEKSTWIGTTWAPFGCSPMTPTVTAAATGSASMPAETYDIYLTSYNSNGEDESSPSSMASVTLTAGQRIRVQISPTSDESASYTHWRIYLRRQTTQAWAYRVMDVENSGGTSVTSTGDIPIASTDVYVDLSAAQIANLILQVPDADSQDPPPTKAKFCTVYGNRMIVADNNAIYWSGLNTPGQFNALDTEAIETDDGDTIKGLVCHSDDLLLILMENSTWGLFGNDPQTWVLKPISFSIGAAGHYSLCNQTPLGTVWWSRTHGPCKFDGSAVEAFGLEKLGTAYTTAAVATSATLASDYVRNTWAMYDEAEQRLMFAYTPVGATANTRVVSFRTLVGDWETNYWEIPACYAMCYARGSAGQFRAYIGGSQGTLFYFDSTALNDAVPSGTRAGTVTPGSSSLTTITTTGLYSTGSGLQGRQLTLISSANVIVAFRTITSASATSMAFSSITVVPGLTYTWVVGLIPLRIYSKWFDAGVPFMAKRWDWAYLYLEFTTASTVNLFTQIDLRTDSDTTGNTSQTVTLSGTGRHLKREPVFRTSHALRASIINYTPNVDLVWNKLSLLGRTLSDRYIR